MPHSATLLSLLTRSQTSSFEIQLFEGLEDCYAAPCLTSLRRADCDGPHHNQEVWVMELVMRE